MSFHTNKAMITDQAMFICAFTIFALAQVIPKRKGFFDRTFLASFFHWGVETVVVLALAYSCVFTHRTKAVTFNCPGPHCPPDSSLLGDWPANGRNLHTGQGPVLWNPRAGIRHTGHPVRGSLPPHATLDAQSVTIGRWRVGQK